MSRFLGRCVVASRPNLLLAELIEKSHNGTRGASYAAAEGSAETFRRLPARRPRNPRRRRLPCLRRERRASSPPQLVHLKRTAWAGGDEDAVADGVGGAVDEGAGAVGRMPMSSLSTIS
jgi:hypothetical protein